MAECNVPLICDEVPGPLPGYLVTCRPMTVAEVERIKNMWRLLIVAPQTVCLDPDPRFEPIRVRRQWPDAEFCAA